MLLHVGWPEHHLLSLCPLRMQDTDPAVTPGPALCAEARAAAQRLLDSYVQVQGAAVAQMLRKSVETRDWLGTVEPRNVRAVMKRVVEDITAIDLQVQATSGLGGDRGEGNEVSPVRSQRVSGEFLRSPKGPSGSPRVFLGDPRCPRWVLGGGAKIPTGSRRDARGP